ncbi:MAG: amino acid adenylation domain-containing protein [Chitinophagaceae bacterium]|nr:amino acid adenylation domain-containing protein [Chitinophagaceae bacterium]
MKKLLKEIRDNNILLELDNGKLKIFTEEPQLHDELLTKIKENKADLIEFLLKNDQSFFNDSYKVKIPVSTIQSEYPLTPAQERIWVLSQQKEGSQAYNISGVYELQGKLEIKELNESFKKIIDRHEILRTIFIEDSDQRIWQRVVPADKFNFNLQLIDASNSIQIEKNIDKIIEEALTEPFDLNKGPLFRVILKEIHKDNWILIFVMHHIISDGWSMNILIKELLSFYTCSIKNINEQLDPLPIQYKDYAIWQQEQLRKHDQISHKEYWLNQFAGELPVLQISTDKKRPPTKKYRGGTIRRIIDADINLGIKRISQNQGGTLFMGLLGVVNVFLYKYTDQTDTIIGTPVANRDHIDIENQIGLYVNTLAIRTQFSSTDSYEILLDKIVKKTFSAYEHQSFPFDELIKELNIERDISRNPLFDVVVVLQNTEKIDVEKDLNVENLVIKEYHGYEQLFSKFDLIFTFEESEDQLVVKVDYNIDIFHESSVKRMMDHLLRLMDSVVRSPSESISQLEFLSKTEIHQILNDFNDSLTAYPSYQSILDLFKEQVKLCGTKTALVCNELAFSYADIDEKSNRLALQIRNLYGVKVGNAVAIILDKSPEMILALLAVLKLGGVYVPIDPEIPAARKEFILDDASVNLLITQSSYIFDLNQYNRQIFAIDIQFDEQADVEEFSTTPVSPEDMAYVMYTSGSTGNPKGVIIEHRNVVRLVKSVTYVDFNINNILLSTGAFSFDATTFEFWGMLLNGGKLILCSKEVLLDQARLAKEIKKQGVKIMWFTSSFLNQLIDSDITLFNGLQTIITGGDKLSPIHIKKLKEYNYELNIINGYGPTENTTFSLTYPIETVTENIPLGKPINNSTAYILNNAGKLLPVGIFGEICVGGHGVAKGYLNHRNLSEERFIKNPYRVGDRIYRTGDMGRWLPDGNIEFLGRNDHQIKIRGYRVELGEVEEVLRQYPEINSAIVIAKSNLSQEKELSAYFLGSKKINISELQEYLKHRLPQYMIPSYFYQLESFPLTTNGKIDQRRLSEISDVKPNNSIDFLLPRNETESKLLKIWQDVLGIQEISVTSDFFEIGGHSLKATRLASQIFKEFEVKIDFIALFSYTSIESQAILIFEAKKGGYSEIPISTIQDSYPLSSSQLRTWALCQLKDGNIAHNISRTYIITGNLDRMALDHSFDMVIGRHEILRTVFREDEEGEIRQWINIHQAGNFNILYEDLRNNENKSELVRELMKKEAACPFDLESGPMLRINLYQVDEKKWVFVFVIHHIICDAWSLKILLSEIFTLYNSQVRRQPSFLQSLRIQYKDYSCWQQGQLTESIFLEHKNYWLQQFSNDIPALDLQGDRIRPSIKTYNGGVITKIIDSRLSEGLKKICLESGSTLYMGLLTLVNIILYRYSGQEDIIIGIPIANREHADLDGQIGFYVNTLALRTKINGKESFLELLDQVKEITLNAYEHQGFPFEELVKSLNLQRDISRNALFDVMVILQNAGSLEVDGKVLEDIKIERFEGAEEMISKFDLTFYYWEIGSDLHTSIEYNSDIYDKATVERISNHLEQVLEIVLANSHLHIDEIDYLTPSEKHQLLFEFNNECNQQNDQTIIELLEQQAIKSPNKIAVEFGEMELSFKSLNEKSNQFGSFLQEEYQIKPNDLIAIILDRTEWLVISIFGILKAGGAYVPIDTEYPIERINFILEDSNCKIVVDNSVLEKFRMTSFKYKNESSKIAAKPEDLAYIIYTSGSTGRPKGVMVEHRNVASFVQNYFWRFFLEPNMVFAASTSYSFDMSVAELVGAPINGMKLLLIDKADPQIILKYMAASKIDVIQLTPSRLTQLINTSTGDIKSYFNNLKVLMVGGESLSQSNYDFLSELKCTKVVGVYGPTETTVWSTSCLLSENNFMSIGRPLLNESILIFNRENRLSPIGVPGEIYIGGSGVARGYLNQSELTSQKFISSPFDKRQRMYRTGDIGKWTVDGNIEFIGRKDEQVKIRGYRIELGEIESCLAKHENINSSITIAKENNYGEQELVTYFIGDQRLDYDALHTFLSRSLPAYMIPTYFIHIDEFPLNENGKIDKKRLPNHQTMGLISENDYRPPENEVQRKLVGLWKDVLGDGQIGIKDNFFGKGGHSLKATRLSSLIYKEFFVRMSLNELFLKATIAEQSKFIIGARKEEFLKIEALPSQDYYDLSPSQNRLWLIDQLGISNISYNIIGTYDFKTSDVKIPEFKKAISKLIERHEILRTIFIYTDDGPKQKILERKSLDIVIEEFADSGLEEQFTISNIQKEIFNAKFKLDVWPLFKLALVKHKEKFSIVFSMHHIISDGWSLGIFTKELSEFYESELTGSHPSLPVLDIQYKDFANWQNLRLKNEDFLDQEKYWKKQLSGQIPELMLPVDHEYSLSEIDKGAKYYELVINEIQSKDISRFIKEHSVSLFTLFIAGFKVLLYRLTNETDITIGIPVANRDREEVKDLIGFFLNTLMLRDKLNINEPFEGLLNKVGKTLMDGLDNQSFPFEKLLESLNIKKDFNKFPISSIFLNMLDFGKKEILATSERKANHGEMPGSGKFDLECYFKEYSNAITIFCVYKSSLFKPETIEYWIQEFVSVIMQVINKRNLKIKDIDLFSKPSFPIEGIELKNVFTYFEEESITQSITSRFEEQVKKVPDNIAIFQEETVITYSQLNSMANGISEKIRTVCLESGLNIALLLEHGIEAVTGIMGVLKSGNAYVPLDPEYPVERLRYVITDTNCRILITSNATTHIVKDLVDNLANYTIINMSCDIQPSAVNPDIYIDPHSVAYILYTSGSTGQAKGIIQLHQNVLHFTRVYTNNLHISASDKFSLLPTYGFDAAVMDIFGALLNGATLYPYNLKRRGIEGLAYWLTANQISILHTVPTIYRYFLNILKEDIFRNVRLVVLGGEAVYKRDFENFKKHFPKNCILVNGYGPTESTITLQKFLDHDSIVTSRNIPIGVPVQETEVYILSEFDEIAKVYEIGELVYSSKYLAVGYWGKESVSNRAFTVSPFDKSKRVYRSGDFGRLLPTGEIEFLGRRDQQVKLNGQRIELNEIEQALLDLPSICEAVVLVKETSGYQQLVAYLRVSESLTESSIRQRLSQRIPLFMLPSIYVFIDKFPLTLTGKISRTDLPDPADPAKFGDSLIEPRNEIEEKLLAIWEEVLGRKKIGINSNYFESGGNSLSTLRIISRVKAEFKINIKVEEIFINPTIQQLADEVARKIWIIQNSYSDSEEMITVTI